MDENMNLTPENNEENVNTPEVEEVQDIQPEIVEESQPEAAPEPEIVEEAQPVAAVSAPQSNSGGTSQTPPPQNTSQNVTYVQNIIQNPAEGSTVLAVIALVCGIIGLLLGCCFACFGVPVCLLCSIPATVCGIISIVKKQGGRGMAVAGLVMGVIGDLFGLVGLFMLIGIFGSAVSMNEVLKEYAGAFLCSVRK